MLVPGRARYDIEGLATAAGTDLGTARALWRALGFALAAAAWSFPSVWVWFLGRVGLTGWDGEHSTEEWEEEPTCDVMSYRWMEGGDISFTIDRKLNTARLTGTLYVDALAYPPATHSTGCRRSFDVLRFRPRLCRHRNRRRQARSRES